MVAGRGCIIRAMQCPCWGWEEGSHRLIWGWPREIRRSRRDGQKQGQVGTWQRFVLPQIEGKDTRTDEKELMKLKKARKQGYISTGEMKVLTNYFLVIKGEDIRMVYNGKLSCLNNSLWAPHSSLLAFQTTLRATYEGTYTADRYIGEIFLNYMLSKEVRPY